MVFSFDFSRIKSITIVIAIIAVVAIIAWLNTKWQVLAGLSSVFGGIDMRMNTQFFGFFAGFLAFIFLVVLINSRFNYFEINHLEILHHHGYLGDIKRLPTTGLQFDKEIYDMLEFLLLRSGRLILYPQGLRQAVVIDNVLSVNKVRGGHQGVAVRDGRDRRGLRGREAVRPRRPHCFYRYSLDLIPIALHELLETPSATRLPRRRCA
jgi:hypothetical protein